METQSELETNGFTLIRSAFAPDEIATLLTEIRIATDHANSQSIKNSRGETWAARNLASHNPRLLRLWRKPILKGFIREVLGDQAGLVRILYFDKHPRRTWSLPWHKDMTIAVRDNQIESNRYTKPTNKSGVAHVEAPVDLLENMVTLRIHLDDVTEDNGPLEVALGSHKNGKIPSQDNRVEKILCRAGDVLAMRPLLSHASGSSREGTTQHRRILHLEFAAVPHLDGGFQWNRFEAIS